MKEVNGVNLWMEVHTSHYIGPQDFMTQTGISVIQYLVAVAQAIAVVAVAALGISALKNKM